MSPPDAAASIDAGSQQYHHSAAIADSREEKIERQAKFWGRMVERYGLAPVLLCVLLVVVFGCAIGGVVVVYRDMGKPAFDKWLAKQETDRLHEEAATTKLAASIEIERSRQEDMKSIAGSLRSIDSKAETHTNLLKAIHHRLTPAHARDDDEHGAVPSEVNAPGLDHPCD